MSDGYALFWVVFAWLGVGLIPMFFGMWLLGPPHVVESRRVTRMLWGALLCGFAWGWLLRGPFGAPDMGDNPKVADKASH